MSGEPSRHAQAADPEHYPGAWDALIEQCIAEGLTDAETLDEIENRSPARPWPESSRRIELIRIGAIRRGMGRREPVRTRPGPKPATTAPAVEEARRKLEADGPTSGEREIAKLLGVSRGAVRYAQGKDRRR